MPMLRVMTSDSAVIEAARGYMPWLLLMPVVGCAAFTWDGIYIGATASKGMRDSMLWAVAAFVFVWCAGILFLNMSGLDGSSRYGVLAMHVLMAAYFTHLLARTIYLTVTSRRIVR